MLTELSLLLLFSAMGGDLPHPLSLPHCTRCLLRLPACAACHAAATISVLSADGSCGASGASSLGVLQKHLSLSLSSA